VRGGFGMGIISIPVQVSGSRKTRKIAIFRDNVENKKTLAEIAMTEMLPATGRSQELVITLLSPALFI